MKILRIFRIQECEFNILRDSLIERFDEIYSKNVEDTKTDLIYSDVVR